MPAGAGEHHTSLQVAKQREKNALPLEDDPTEGLP